MQLFQEVIAIAKRIGISKYDLLVIVRTEIRRRWQEGSEEIRDDLRRRMQQSCKNPEEFKAFMDFVESSEETITGRLTALMSFSKIKKEREN